jgi:hypothetical protein
VHGLAIPKSYDSYAYIIRLEARIVGIEPSITRTLELPCDLNFAQLHEVLQAAFAWTDSHLHQFYVGGLTIGAPEAIEDAAYGPKVFEATDVRLKDLTFPNKVDATLTITYQYDFGDNWQRRLMLRRVEVEDGVKYPRCTVGDRASPPEDVGGYSGYADFLEAGLTTSMKSTRQCGDGRVRSSIQSALTLMRPTRPSPRPCAIAEAITGKSKSEPVFRSCSRPILLKYLRPNCGRSRAKIGCPISALHSLP